MRSALLLVALAPAALGCAGSVSEPVEAGGPGSTSAIVTVERALDPVAGGRAGASARVLKVSGSTSTDEALRAIGASLELPAAGTCVELSSRAWEGASGPMALLELVDVGAVTLDSPGGETRLAPRQLPDVTDVVTGVVYSRAVDPALLPASAAYTLRVGGSPGFEGFEARVTAPDDALDVHFAGEDAAGIALGSAGADLAWSSPGRGEDVVYVDVRPRGVRCTLPDATRGSLGGTLLDASGTLVVHRLRREALRAPGLSAGEVRFDFSRSVAYGRR